MITGGILGPVAAGLVIQKPILLPLGFRNAVLELDLWLLDGWEGAAVELSFADAALRITGEAHAPRDRDRAAEPNRHAVSIA